MTVKKLIEIDPTDRDDGKIPAWSDADATHVYVAPLTNPMDGVGQMIKGGASGAATKLDATGSGKVPTGTGSDVAMAYPPGYELAYAAITTDFTSTQACASVDTVITAGAFTADGGAYMFEFYSYAVEPSATAGRNIQIMLYEDGSLVGLMAYVQTPATGTMRVPATARKKYTPSAGSHTYTIRACHSGGAGKIYANAGAPSYLRITKA